MVSNDLSGRPVNVLYMYSPPTSGQWQIGDEIRNLIPQPGGSMGWVCTTSGTANGNSWQSHALYQNGTLVNANGNVYECIAAGTSGSTAPSGTASRITDGNCVWQYVDTLAVFYAFGLISTT